MIKIDNDSIEVKGDTKTIIAEISTLIYWTLKAIIVPTAKKYNHTIVEEFERFVEPAFWLIKKEGEENEDNN